MFRKVFLLIAGLALAVSSYSQSGTSRLVNRSGGVVNQYEVVVADTANDTSFTTTTTARDSGVVGIAWATIADDASGRVVLPGQIATVAVVGAVSRGDYLVTSTTAGSAASGGTTDISGAFGIALEAGTDTNIDCYLFTPTLIGASSTMTVTTLAATTSITLGDDDNLIFGADSDIQVMYDETTDNRLEWHDGTNLLMALADGGTTGNLYITGNLSVGESAPDAQLIVKKSGSTFNFFAGTTVGFQNDGTTGTNCLVSLISGNAAAAKLHFGDTDDEDAGSVVYDHSTNALTFYTNGNTLALTISSAQNATLVGDLAVNGGDLTTTQTTFNLLNGTATTINFGAAATVALNIGGASAKIGLFGATAVARPSTTGEATGYTGGGGTALTHTDTFTGNSGTKAYTINDIVKHLKAVGILTGS